MAYTEDQRWIGHYNISTSKLTIDSPTALDHTWTIEMWLNLKPFPLVRGRGTNQLTVKPLEIKYTDKYLIVNGTQIKYQQQEWFQLVLVSGSEGSLVRDSIRAYINGKLVNHSISGPSNINRLVFKNHSIRKNPLETGSMLGLVRMYNVPLGKHYIRNNYSSNAAQFGLELYASGPVTKYGLVKIVPKPKDIDIDAKKNATTSYSKMNSSELHQLSKLFVGSANRPRARARHVSSSCQNKQRHPTKKAIPSNVFKVMSLLNSNPEMFMNMLQGQANAKAKATATDSQASISVEEADSLFSDPVKVELLVSYFKRSPKSLIAVLKNNLLNSEQLSKLRSNFDRNDSDGFHDYNPDLEQALALLDSKANLHPQQSAPIVDSLDRIANIMQYDRKKQQIIRDVNAKHGVLSSIKRLNDSSLTNEAKLNQLEKVLAKQNEILGLVVSQRSGKCVGAIKGNGKIKKAPTVSACKCKGRCNCTNNDSSPYNIILNTQQYQVNMKNILNQHQLQGQTIKKLVKISQKPSSELTIVGQCVNRNYLTIAAIVVYKKENHYLPTTASKPYPGLPILAMIDANPEEDTIVQSKTEATATTEIVDEATEADAEATAECASGKCGPGFKAVEPEIAKKGWLSHLSESESESEGSQSSLFAYTSLFK